MLYESVLRNLPGDVETARGQLDRLTKVADLPSVTLQVFPFSNGTHQGLNGSFNIVSFAGPGAMDVVYSEAAFKQTWIEGGEGATAYDELFELIASRSLDERESISFIHNLSKDL